MRPVVMSASALAAIWIAALLPGTAVIVLVLVKRAAASHDQDRHTDDARPSADAATRFRRRTTAARRRATAPTCRMISFSCG